MEGYVFTKNNAYKVSQRIEGGVIQCRGRNGKSVGDKKRIARVYMYM